MSDIEILLQKTSRTFALTIPCLPQPTRDEVGIAYLLFRIIDTFEDAVLWSPEKRLQALADFIHVLDGPASASQALADEWTRNPPLIHDGYQELLARTPYVLERFEALRPEVRQILRTHVARSAEGMASFVRRVQPEGRLQLDTIADLRAYCYAVAGIVGEMLTELFVQGRESMQRVAPELRSRAAAFGEGLQLVNILKDARPDAMEGRTFLPRQAPLREVFALARQDLADAAAYVDLLREGGAEPGLVAFNAFICKLAAANLQILRDQGLGAKLTRLTVAKIAAEVAVSLGVETPKVAARA
ncbi:MAG TPA: squalene/phytoene synthase family protein [Polyangia bacterium]|nr:squalene/phytoene synthase family protein [Polyangia bacterium]